MCLIVRASRRDWAGIFSLGRTFEKSILNQPLAALADFRCVISLISQRISVRHNARLQYCSARHTAIRAAQYRLSQFEPLRVTYSRPPVVQDGCGHSLFAVVHLDPCCRLGPNTASGPLLRLHDRHSLPTPMLLGTMSSEWSDRAA
jgi:hypothetical protein